MRLIILVLGILVTPIPAMSQPASRVPTVGVLAAHSATTPINVQSRTALEQGLTELGWVPGQTIRIEYRYAGGRPENLDELARDLVRLPVDVIVARATAPIRAAKQATATIPIVMSASGVDPVQLGLVASFARPGGNVTGLTLLNQDIYIKQLELLKEVIPQLLESPCSGARTRPSPRRDRRIWRRPPVSWG
jgi:putative ABC transport system substrate-binding protein